MEKNSEIHGYYNIQTSDLSITSPVLFQLSYAALSWCWTQCIAISLLGVPVRSNKIPCIPCNQGSEPSFIHYNPERDRVGISKKIWLIVDNDVSKWTNGKQSVFLLFIYLHSPCKLEITKITPKLWLPCLYIYCESNTRNYPVHFY